MRQLDVSTQLIHHFDSSIALVYNLVGVSKFPLLSLSAFVLSMSVHLQCSGPYITPGKLDISSPKTLATSRIGGQGRGQQNLLTCSLYIIGFLRCEEYSHDC